MRHERQLDNLNRVNEREGSMLMEQEDKHSSYEEIIRDKSDEEDIKYEQDYEDPVDLDGK